MKFKWKLISPELFIKKLALLCLATLLLVPLVYYKLEIPAMSYLVILIVIHLIFLFLYLFKVEWRSLTPNKITFILRLAAVIFFAYILAILKLVGEPLFVLLNLAVAFVVHALILFFLMIKLEKQP